MTGKAIIHARIDALISATNAFEVDATLALFSPEAIIDDPSTGECFEHHAGIRDYIERFFVGYHTVTRLLSIENLDDGRTRARVDFTGDFGHEIGRLDMTFDTEGLILRIDADLE